MDICDTIPAKRFRPPAGLAFGQSERGLFSFRRPIWEQAAALGPALAALAANAFGRGPFWVALKVYGALFLPILVMNSTLYGWQLAALPPLLAFIIESDGTSNSAMYFPLQDRLSTIFADRPASATFSAAKSGGATLARAALVEKSRGVMAGARAI